MFVSCQVNPVLNWDNLIDGNFNFHHTVDMICFRTFLIEYWNRVEEYEPLTSILTISYRSRKSRLASRYTRLDCPSLSVRPCLDHARCSYTLRDFQIGDRYLNIQKPEPQSFFPRGPSHKQVQPRETQGATDPSFNVICCNQATMLWQQHTLSTIPQVKWPFTIILTGPLSLDHCLTVVGRLCASSHPQPPIGRDRSYYENV